MKSNLTPRKILALMLLFVWADTLSPASPPLSWANLLEPCLALVAMLCFYSESFFTGAVTTLVAGIIMDALAPAPVYTAVFAGVFYFSIMMSRMFYNPGSPPHIISYAPGLLVARFALFMAGNGWPNVTAAPFLSMIAGATGDFIIFVCMVFAFRKRDQAVMYKMR